ncbi:MAG TPA: hypothetical protein H9830_09605 [Candidatus Agrococcus pullicola]|uniref:Erythromycin biosynthesis protein CIII-like C-terminal domain-containing protein n=1 Tax=Candidatus Agrococcus pullicola TaxID=2838429 RepID=A0A9D1YVJ8_9MICO|nr:hypothetical protein [Candidatus Agrococcus pullicola]
MATVLFCPATFNLAETTRMIEVARALRDEHTPVFMGYEYDFVPLIRDAGFDYRPRTPVWTRRQRDQAMAFDQGRGIRTPFTTELVSARVDTERELIRELDAKAVVTGTNITSWISARAERVPLFYPVPLALTEPHVGQTRHLGLLPGDGRMTRWMDRVASSVLRTIYTKAPLAPRAFETVAKANGVEPLRTVSSLLNADHNLLTTMQWEIDGFELPANFERVGPIFAQLDRPLPPVVESLAEDSRPLVYLGLGSSASRKLALAAATALASLPVNVVAPIGHYLEPQDTLPDNVHVTDLLPAHKLGGLVDAAVLHGGQGTVQTACATGIPFVGMGLQPEQTWNVRVCERRGNAIAVSPRHVSTTRFTDAVRRILADPGYRLTARSVKAEFAAEDGAAASARLIEASVARAAGGA